MQEKIDLEVQDPGVQIFIWFVIGSFYQNKYEEFWEANVKSVLRVGQCIEKNSIEFVKCN